MMEQFLLEKKLKDTDESLHRRVVESIAVLEHMLESFYAIFPDFTDHTILHSLDVLDYCNQLLGEEQVERLSAAEAYVLIMSCYLHDIGMGVSDKDYEQFSKEIDFGAYFESHDKSDKAEIIRAFHNDFSGCFIKKYAGLFDIPSDELTFAIVQVSRGHRKTDLFDEKEYPDIVTADGIIRTAALAAFVRLADEIDVAADRNPELLFDTSSLTAQNDIEAFGTHESIRRVEILEDSIALITKLKAPEYAVLVDKLVGKIQKTLDYCRAVAEKRSDLRIRQKRVETVRADGETAG